MFQSVLTPLRPFTSCADYVKHLLKSVQDKDEAVSKLKADLEVKQREIDEDKALQESRSDPESVTSSLTSSTTDSAAFQRLSNMRPNTDAASGGKRKASNNESEGTSKKYRVMTSRNTSSISTSEESSGGEDRRSGSTAQSFSIDKTVSSVSDITDSNRGSSSNSGSNSGFEERTEQISRVSADDQDDEEGNDKQQSSSSISSDAAVASGKESRELRGSRHHADVVFKNEKAAYPGHKRPPEEITSLERSFELDYEEVFEKSNIPQLIAATSGKIVTCEYLALVIFQSQ